VIALPCCRPATGPAIDLEAESSQLAVLEAEAGIAGGFELKGYRSSDEQKEISLDRTRSCVSFFVDLMSE